jgi:predicted transposase/invertase (TIGR01784 family)
MKSKYINPFTDYGFKKIFGEEASKPLLIDFLNCILPEKSKIIDLQFKNTEHLADIAVERKAVFDIYCENEQGDKFIVELQKAKFNFFKERMVYYSTFPIREQVEKGYWNFELKAVYCIGILDFVFDDYDEVEKHNDVLHIIKLKDQQNRIFYDKLTYIYIEMPNFKKEESQLDSRLDKWLFFLKHLEDFQQIPKIFQDSVFTQAFEIAGFINMNYLEMEKYEMSLKIYRDLNAVLDTQYETGKFEGKLEGKIEGIIEGIEKGKFEEKYEITDKLYKSGMEFERIAEIVGLSVEDIKLYLKL